VITYDDGFENSTNTFNKKPNYFSCHIKLMVCFLESSKTVWECRTEPGSKAIWRRVGRSYMTPSFVSGNRLTYAHYVIIYEISLVLA